MSSKARYKRTREEILDAAWTLVSEKGAEVSISEIAKAAGISRQSVYLHFGTRGGLLVALVRRADDRFEIKERLFACFDIVDPRERLQESIRVWIDFVIKIHPVAKDLVRLRETDQDAATAWEDRMSDLRDWLTILIQSLKSDNELSDDWSIKEATEYLWASFSVQMWSLLTLDCQWSFERTEVTLVRTITKTLLKDLATEMTRTSSPHRV
ncbi:MAG: TetR/AcrR family transcriptional regulator [Cyanobacteria bacterium P01_A01_bin.123]